MSDIFISYSSKDKEKADQLSELLASAGFSIWIDQSGIDVATSWSGEIVDAIEGCKAFIVLLSPNSIGSKNVVREVALAFEKNKKILPLDLEPVALNRDLQYLLAGIQRAPMTNIDAIIRALGKLGLEATSPPQPPRIVKGADSRKSLMILPFEDFSPTSDNEWFADGLASELVNSLSNIKRVRIIDWNTSKLFKDRSVKTIDLARELSVRYFIEGQVRKFGDQIKISVTLIDIETGDYLWQDSLRGEMKDIFEMQDKVAEKVVAGMKLHLSDTEKHKLTDRHTESDEAYAIYLRAIDYRNRHTRDGYKLAAQLCKEALQLDPNYSDAMALMAFSLTGLYRNYDRDPDLLVQSEHLSREYLRLRPNSYRVYGTLSDIYRSLGNVAEAESIAKEFIRIAPEDYTSYSSMAFFYMETGQWSEAIPHFEKVIELNPDFLIIYFNLIIVCANAGNSDKLARWSNHALPIYERRLRLAPDDESSRQQYAIILHFAGKTDDARHELEILITKKDLDPGTLYNIASLQEDLNAPDSSLSTLRRSVEDGFARVELLEGWRTKDWVLADPNAAKELENIITLAKQTQAGKHLNV